MPPIQPNIDAYGTYARASALADYLELKALLGRPMLRAGLQDLIVDRWEPKASELFVEGTGSRVEAEPDETELDPEIELATEPKLEDGVAAQFTQRIFDLLAERSTLLGIAYPFSLEKDTVTLRDGIQPKQSMYVAMLAITTAHAYNIDVTDEAERRINVKQILEDTVTRALEAITPPAVNVGLISRGEREFPKTVAAAAAAVGLKPSPMAATYKKSANEEGVDVLAHLPVGDVRSGVWTFLGQVTCGESDTWEGKIVAPKEALWKARLNTGVDPLCFLAVPHHVEPVHLGHLVEGNKRIVIDRLRIVGLGLSPTSEEQLVVDAVLVTGVEQVA